MQNGDGINPSSLTTESGENTLSGIILFFETLGLFFGIEDGAVL